MATRKTVTPVKRRGRPAGSRNKEAAAASVFDTTSQPEAQPVTDSNEAATAVELVDIQILDLTGMPYNFKAIALAMLADAGYLWANTLQRPLQNTTDLNIDAINFNHTNKLIHAATKAEVSEGSAVSTMAMDIDIKAEFSQPTSVKPAFIEVNGARYARIA